MLARRRAESEARYDAYRRQQTMTNAERLASFRSGGPMGTRCDSEHGGAAVRVSADGTRFQTSWGVDVSLTAGRELLRTYFSAAAPQLIGCSIDGFTVRTVDTLTASGIVGTLVESKDTDAHGRPWALQIGCHDFSRAELVQLATLIALPGATIERSV